MKTVYIDSNVFLNSVLYNLEENDEAKRSHNFLQKIIAKKVIGATSVLTWDEFTWITKRELDKETAIKKGNEFLLFPDLIFLKITQKTIKKAQDLFSKYNIKPRDAIHCASALENGISTIISFDDDFDCIHEITRKEPS
ncbi:MAG: PIN domain-containing protein [Promethearchaeota archaeon]|nr:MAG: PIN domain-containing protein [Candidatus Lokiarchaeota archaeon]